MTFDPKRRKSPPCTRADLLDCAAVIRSRIRHGKDPVLKALAFSTSGIAHFYQSEYGMSDDEAALLADATVWLVQSFKGKPA